MKRTLLTLAVVALFAGSANAATWYSTVTNGNFNNWDQAVTSWTANPDGTGGNPTAIPTAGDTDTWVVQGGARGQYDGPTWHGGTTRFDKLSDADFAHLLAFNGGRTLQDVFLNGGGLTSNGQTISGDTLSVDGSNGGVFGVEGTGTQTIDFSAMTGSGTVRVLGVFNGGIQATDNKTVVAGGTDLSGYTGTFQVLDDSELEFGGDVTTATFGLEVEVADGGGIEATYSLANNVSVTSATLGGTALAAGTYNGSDLNNLGLGAFVTDNNGTLTVIPEPASLALVGIGGLLIASRRRRA